MVLRTLGLSCSRTPILLSLCLLKDLRVLMFLKVLEPFKVLLQTSTYVLSSNILLAPSPKTRSWIPRGLSSFYCHLATRLMISLPRLHCPHRPLSTVAVAYWLPVPVSLWLPCWCHRDLICVVLLLKWLDLNNGGVHENVCHLVIVYQSLCLYLGQVCVSHAYAHNTN